MDNETAHNGAPGTNYADLAAQQETKTANLAEEIKKNASPELIQRYERENDLLKHYRAAAAASPVERAKQAAERARTSVLSRAITQRLA
jgi:hypothetical protein